MPQGGDDVVELGESWDVVVVGTGMGGGMLGLRLAQKEMKVLFLEKGLRDIAVGAPEQVRRSDRETRLRKGRWPYDVNMMVDGRSTWLDGARGCCVGGSTRLYAAVLERFEPHDFRPTADLPHTAGLWPVSPEIMNRYYEEAEILLQVSGTQDPLSAASCYHLYDPPDPTALDHRLLGDFTRAGLKPYRCHTGISYRSGCLECLGHPCESRCKSDTKWLCIEPAVRDHGASLYTECSVELVEADGDSVRSVIYDRHGVRYRARARIIVLAAGALETPRLLLTSVNTAHPHGLSNSSGLVGRNLMFHGLNWLAIWPLQRTHKGQSGKSIASREFYSCEWGRGGVLQSAGRFLRYGDILMHLYERFDRSRFRALTPIRPFLRIMAKIIHLYLGRAAIFALMIEDFPYRDNRIEVEKGGSIRIVYRIRQEFRVRNAKLRRALDGRLARHRRVWLNPDMQLNEGHACGTCRFGADPASSVLDPSCRAHDIDNLYVVDASFMPTSGGANPGLTIAANALRVADLIAERYRNSQAEAHRAITPVASHG